MKTHTYPVGHAQGNKPHQRGTEVLSVGVEAMEVTVERRGGEVAGAKAVETVGKRVVLAEAVVLGWAADSAAVRVAACISCSVLPRSVA